MTADRKRLKQRFFVAVLVFVLFAALGTLIVSCSPGPDTSSSLPSSPQSDDTPISSSPQSATAPSSTQEQSLSSVCTSLTGQAALQQWGPSVPQAWADLPEDDPRRWDLLNASTETYDPCSPLSWIILSNSTGALSGPRHIMLFQEGRYTGTLTKTPAAYPPRITRIGSDTIKVVYSWAHDGEQPEAPTGTSTVTVTANPDKSVTTFGTLPPVTEPRDSDDSAPPVLGAWPGAGGPPPMNAIPAPMVVPAGTSHYANEATAVFTTPSRNIICDLLKHTGRCLIRSYQQDRPHGSTEGGMARWAVHAIGQPSASVGAQTQDTPAHERLTSLPVVEYGTSITFGDMVCASADNGLTCWNVLTSHGAFMNRTQTLFF